jgi:spore germination cell wall hydrolase CwlJ-like protein
MNNLVIDLPTEADVMTADWNELECLAANIYHEARGEDRLGQELVAQVTVNRMKEGFFPDTACGVVRQSYQFSWTHDGRSDAIKDRRAYERAYKIAIEYLYLGKQAQVEFADQLINYHAHYVSPDWSNLEPVAVAGGHRFYRRLST